ncbi:MAG TPA: hypothetical protein VNO14_11130, partial [Blastocatellia bacterium]|nr:hypothetical protein [Blastocatellia bacterium]
MPPDSLDRLLSQLEQSTRRFDSEWTSKLLARIGRRRFADAESLVRFHEALLFLRAHPQNAEVLDQAERLLGSFAARVGALRDSGIDLTPFDYIESSGIAGTVITGTFSFNIARWLASRYPSRVDVDWERYEKKERLANVLPRIIPLLYEDTLVEANIPYMEWLHGAGKRGGRDLKRIIEGLERLSISERERAELYDLLELPIRWELGDSSASRTKNMRKVRKVFYHTGPFIRRSEVSLEEELRSRIEFERLPAAKGEAILDMVREATTVRYRELYGITNGDGRNVLRADVGRGVEIFLWGLPAERRLPLRAYHAGFTLKNGVPINYIEAITLFERAEVGFNTFYTYRDGESAWVYAKVLAALNQAAEATCFSIDPYQLGFNNDEAIESGAFWFYRKMGFRPVDPELLKLTEREERKLAADPSYRTPHRTLRRLSKSNALYEMDPSRR